MNRSVPMWVFLLSVLLLSMASVAFGWLVKTTVRGSDNGFLGRAAVEIASFPTTTKLVLSELLNVTVGSRKDMYIIVRRDEGFDYSTYKEFPSAPGVDVEGLLFQADTSKTERGWRLLVGAFTVNGAVENAAVLISPDFVIHSAWVLDEIPIDGVTPRPKHRKFVHGFDIIKSGSFVFTYDGSNSLQRFDACGNREWAVGGNYHHSVTLHDDEQSVWTWKDDNIVRVSVADGEILKSISFDDIIEKNPLLDLFEVRRRHKNDHENNSRNTDGIWLQDPFHGNDIDPLPAAIADQFPGFDAGDLLISLRSLNLVFVVDPDSYKVKWWRSGFVQRQHDPDWMADGTIAVFNNRMSRDFSEITAIDPKTYERSTLFDGQNNNFYTRFRGKHQPLDNGTLLVTSPQQGRAFEVSRDGEIVLEIANVKPGSDEFNYAISEIKWFPEDHFDTESWTCPSKEAS